MDLTNQWHTLALGGEFGQLIEEIYAAQQSIAPFAEIIAKAHQQMERLIVARNESTPCIRKIRKRTSGSSQEVPGISPSVEEIIKKHSKGDVSISIATVAVGDGGANSDTIQPSPDITSCSTPTLKALTTIVRTIPKPVVTADSSHDISLGEENSNSTTSCPRSNPKNPTKKKQTARKLTSNYRRKKDIAKYKLKECSVLLYDFKKAFGDVSKYGEGVLAGSSQNCGGTDDVVIIPDSDDEITDDTKSTEQVANPQVSSQGKEPIPKLRISLKGNVISKQVIEPEKNISVPDEVICLDDGSDSDEFQEPPRKIANVVTQETSDIARASLVENGDASPSKIKKFNGLDISVINKSNEVSSTSAEDTSDKVPKNTVSTLEIVPMNLVPTDEPQNGVNSRSYLTTRMYLTSLLEIKGKMRVSVLPNNIIPSATLNVSNFTLSAVVNTNYDQHSSITLNRFTTWDTVTCSAEAINLPS